MHRWTDEQIAFIADAYQRMDRQQVTEAVNERFGLSLSLNQVRAALKNRKIKSGRDGRFVPGRQTTRKTPVPKGEAPGRFKKGRPAKDALNYRPIGSTRISKDGYIERKVTDDPTLVPARRWVGEHRLIWEAHNGPVPAGHVVVFLDGDPTNLSLENLRCVQRGVLAVMNKRGLSKSTGEARKAAILASELDQAAKNRRSA